MTKNAIFLTTEDIILAAKKFEAISLCLVTWERSPWIIAGLSHLPKTEQLIEWAKLNSFDVLDRRPEFQRIELRLKGGSQ